MSAERGQRVLTEAQRLLDAGVAGKVFPGGSACLSFRDGGQVIFVEAFAGKLMDGLGPVDATTMYDLASLTKPVVAMAALRQVMAGRLTLETKPEQLLADTRGSPGGAATLEQLFTHRSGLAAWGGLYLDVPHDPGTNAARRWIVMEAARRVQEPPKVPVLYSDLGYMLAGETLAKAAAEPLDRVVLHAITEPLGIETGLVYAGALHSEPAAALAKKAAPTERDEWRGRLVRGEVHDENCAALGGVSGHAGLFGRAKPYAQFARAVLDSHLGRGTFLRSDLVAHALAPRPGGTRLFGWDQKSPEQSTAGRRMSAESFGHLGFTGTSVWCDAKRDLVVVLLTNRVCPTRANERIKGFRPAFHDGILAAFDS